MTVQKPDELAQSYDHGDAGNLPPFKPETIEVANATATEAPTESRPTPPKDPATGRFISKHNALLLRVAKEEGFSEDEAESVDSPTLERYLSERRQTRVALETARATRETKPTIEQEPIVPVDESLDWGEVDGERLRDDDINPGIVKFRRDAEARIAQLEAVVKSLMDAEHGRQAERTGDQIDDVFASLGEPFQAVFGKGNRKSLPPTSPEFLRRKAIYDQAVAQVGPKGTIGDLVKKIPEVAQLMFGITAAAPKEPEKKNGSNGHTELAERQSVWKVAGAAIPTQRASSPKPKGEDRAVDAVTNFLKTNPDFNRGAIVASDEEP